MQQLMAQPLSWQLQMVLTLSQQLWKKQIRLVLRSFRLTLLQIILVYRSQELTTGKTAGEQVLAALEAKGVKEGKIGIVSVNAATTSTVDRDEGFRSAFEGTAFEILETQYADGDAAKSKDAAANFISQGCVALFGANEGSCVGVGNAVAEDGNNIVAAGMDKSDAVIQLIKDGALICTMAQNPDVMGYEGMYAAITAINDGKVAPEYIDTGVSILNLDAVK